VVATLEAFSAADRWQSPADSFVSMPPIPPPRSSGVTTTTDVPLYWCAYGEPGAPRVLVLHGGPGASHDYLLPQMLRLGNGRELLFYDQRGGGRSRVDADVPVGWEAHVADLARVVAELDVDPLVLVGYSWGGLLAMLYAIEAAGGRLSPAPDALLLIDPAPVARQLRAVFEAEFARRQASPAVQRLREELAASGLRERDAEGYRHRAFELSVAGYFADPDAARDLTPFRVIGRVQQDVWGSLGDYDVTPALSSVRCRALVVHGREDPIPLSSSEACARALGARLVVLDRCGHVPYVEQPEALFEAAETFLGHR
jgi:proline iminopeptidase